MNLRKIAWTAVVVACATLSLQAHPGHGALTEGAKHFATSPYHLAPVILFSLALCVAAQFLNSQRERGFVRAIAAVITLVAVLS